VVTHHLPHQRSVAWRYKQHKTSGAYASRLSASLIRRCGLWIHGHTHDTVNHRFGDAAHETRVMSNPRGYRMLWLDGTENPRFEPAWWNFCGANGLRKAMRLLILSDLHNEFEPFEPVHTDADVVILAGDIGTKARAAQWAASAFGSLPVVLVAGNHDLWGSSIPRGYVKMREAAQGTNVHVEAPSNS
jgi:predicted phosphodiesterase